MTDQNENVQFLDLDALVPDVQVSIQLGGEKHIMAEMNVQDFAWAQKMTAKQEAINPEDEVSSMDMMSDMIDMLDRQFPTCERQLIADLPLRKLTALIKFTSQMGAEGAEAAVAEAEADGGKVTVVETGEDVPTQE